MGAHKILFWVIQIFLMFVMILELDHVSEILIVAFFFTFLKGIGGVKIINPSILAGEEIVDGLTSNCSGNLVTTTPPPKSLRLRRFLRHYIP